MSKFNNWLKNSIYFILTEFFGQIMAAIILIAAFVAWVYFSSMYAAILIVIAGIILWSLLNKLFIREKIKTKNDKL